jgi:hypothetical protein
VVSDFEIWSLTVGRTCGSVALFVRAILLVLSVVTIGWLKARHSDAYNQWVIATLNQLINIGEAVITRFL